MRIILESVRQSGRDNVTRVVTIVALSVCVIYRILVVNITGQMLSKLVIHPDSRLV